jgi:hypothetical protein
VTQDYHRTIPSGDVILTYPRSFARPGGAVDLVLSLGQTYNWAGNSGSGTIADPYRIQTPGQLESLGDYPDLWDKSFILTADLDMAGRTYTGALIATDVNTATGFQGTPFRGSFNGNKHTVQNLRIVSDSYSPASYLGLFGMIDKAGQVYGLTLKDVTILAGTGSSSPYVGALAGYNAGTVVDCSSTGAISAGCSSHVSGLIGSNLGSAVNCHTDVIIIGSNCGGTTRGS